MNESLLLIDAIDPAITIFTLNRPDKRNALSIDLIEQLTTAIIDTSNDRARRVIVIRGAGPVFCAGLDLKEASDPAKTDRSAQALAKMFEAIATSPLITIAAAHGAAFGGGAGLIAACDFAIGAENLQLGYPEVHRGLVAALVTALLHRQLPERTVRELVLLGQTINADRALQLGLINRIVPTAELDSQSLAISRQSCSGAPGAIARSKRLLDALSSRDIATDLHRALDFHLHSRHSSEAAEGMAAFLEKRPPRWGLRSDDQSEDESEK